MSVANNARLAVEAGNDVKTAFDFAFKIFATTDLKCWKVSAAGVYTLGVLNTDYTVAFDTDAETGVVTWTVAPVSSGFSVIQGSELPESQATSFPRDSAIPANTHRNALDKLTILVQQLEDKLDRAVLSPETPVNPETIEITAPVDGEVLVYDEQDDGSFQIEPSGYTLAELAADVAAAAASAAAAAASASSASSSSVSAAASASAASVSAAAAAASAAVALAASSAKSDTYAALIVIAQAAPTTPFVGYATDLEAVLMYSGVAGAGPQNNGFFVLT